MASEPDVSAVNLARRIALRDDDVIGVITNMIDADGEFTDAPQEATSAVVKWPDGNWGCIDLSKFDFGTRNQ